MFGNTKQNENKKFVGTLTNITKEFPCEKDFRALARVLSESSRMTFRACVTYKLVKIVLETNL